MRMYTEVRILLYETYVFLITVKCYEKGDGFVVDDLDIAHVNTFSELSLPSHLQKNNLQAYKVKQVGQTTLLVNDSGSV